MRPEPDHAPTLEQLRTHLWGQLPGYAWPSALVLDGRPAVGGGRPPPAAVLAEA